MDFTDFLPIPISVLLIYPVLATYMEVYAAVILDSGLGLLGLIYFVCDVFFTLPALEWMISGMIILPVQRMMEGEQGHWS